LLPSLGRLVRGLSALFWGLPVALIICLQALKTDSLRPFGVLPPVIVTGWLVYALWELGHFQKQERVWLAALGRAQLLGVINLGLAPFIFFWNRLPGETFYNQMLLLLLVCSLLFLSSVNMVLRRLAAMLPDQMLRTETKHFGTLNRGLLLAALLLALAYLGLRQIPGLPLLVIASLMTVERLSLWLIIGLVLLPLAVTMALIWKIKEVVLGGVFGGKS
jgi:hypothetical protein